MNLRALIFASALLCLSGPAVFAGDASDLFTAPKEWQMMPSGDNGVISFQTNANKADALMIVIRPVRSGGQSAAQWAADEVAAIEKQGFKLVDPPAEKTIGTAKFVRMTSWNDLAGFGLRNEQYFCDYPGRSGLLEVAVLGPDENFKAERGRVDEFLGTFRAG